LSYSVQLDASPKRAVKLTNLLWSARALAEVPLALDIQHGKSRRLIPTLTEIIVVFSSSRLDPSPLVF